MKGCSYVMRFFKIFYQPLELMYSLNKKPNIALPLLFSALIPLLYIQVIFERFEHVESKWLYLIALGMSCFSLMTFFITSFTIYLLLNTFMLDREISFKTTISIYGFSQMPKIFFAISLLLFPFLDNTNISQYDHFLIALSIFIINPFNIWRYMLLICGFHVLINMKIKKLIAIAIIFVIIEVCIIFFGSDITHIFR